MNDNEYRMTAGSVKTPETESEIMFHGQLFGTLAYGDWIKQWHKQAR